MKLSPVLLFCIYLLAMVIATLWPFNFLQHNLATLAPTGGLTFKQPAIAFTQTPPSKLSRMEKFTVVLRVGSLSSRERACILDYGTDEHHTNLRLQQENDQLDVWVESAGGHPGAGLHLPRVFEHSDTSTIVVSFDGEKLHAWKEGGARKTTQIGPGEHLHWDSSATLTLGSLVDGQNGWRGTIFLLAITDRPTEPMAAPVQDSLRRNAVLYYDFMNLTALEIPDEAGSVRNPLWIPEQYTVPSRIILASPAHYNWHTRWFVFDMAVNILAFIPFGFLGGMVFIRKLESIPRGVGVAILAAFVFSLSVELLQAWLPSRNSSLVDLFCDVAGAGTGAWLAGITGIQRLIRRLGIVSTGQDVT
jgi:glycopeptide antibiotics resistance protein